MLAYVSAVGSMMRMRGHILPSPRGKSPTPVKHLVDLGVMVMLSLVAATEFIFPGKRMRPSNAASPAHLALLGGRRAAGPCAYR